MASQIKKDTSAGNHKLKILYLMKILTEKTDETHDISLAEIGEQLESYGIVAERKSLYRDIENLRTYGMDIVGTKVGKGFRYQVVSRQFELAELKLLVDSVQSAKFLTEGKSRELIRKIESFASEHEAKKLHRQVNVNGRVKTQNNKVYYTVDAIHEAISNNNQLKFQYFSWNEKKEMELRHGGEWYEISPWAVCWDDEKYYMIGFDEKSDSIKYYRVDKMLKAAVLDRSRTGKEQFEKSNITELTNRQFGMFDGEVKNVRLLCKNNMANVIIDRFGNDVTLMKEDDEHFSVSVNVAVSNQFLGWIMGLTDVQIVAPSDVVDKMKLEVEKLYSIYCK